MEALSAIGYWLSAKSLLAIGHRFTFKAKSCRPTGLVHFFISYPGLPSWAKSLAESGLAIPPASRAVSPADRAIGTCEQIGERQNRAAPKGAHSQNTCYPALKRWANAVACLRHGNAVLGLRLPVYGKALSAVSFRLSVKAKPKIKTKNQNREPRT
jgi:hypothetical protein